MNSDEKRVGMIKGKRYTNRILRSSPRLDKFPLVNARRVPIFQTFKQLLLARFSHWSLRPGLPSWKSGHNIETGASVFRMQRQRQLRCRTLCCLQSLCVSLRFCLSNSSLDRFASDLPAEFLFFFKAFKTAVVGGTLELSSFDLLDHERWWCKEVCW